jgi:hypothetical protein
MDILSHYRPTDGAKSRWLKLGPGKGLKKDLKSALF